MKKDLKIIGTHYVNIIDRGAYNMDEFDAAFKVAVKYKSEAKDE